MLARVSDASKDLDWTRLLEEENWFQPLLDFLSPYDDPLRKKVEYATPETNENALLKNTISKMMEQERCSRFKAPMEVRRENESGSGGQKEKSQSRRSRWFLPFRSKTGRTPPIPNQTTRLERDDPSLNYIGDTCVASTIAYNVYEPYGGCDPIKIYGEDAAAATGYAEGQAQYMMRYQAGTSQPHLPLQEIQPHLPMSVATYSNPTDRPQTDSSLESSDSGYYGTESSIAHSRSESWQSSAKRTYKNDAIRARTRDALEEIEYDVSNMLAPVDNSIRDSGSRDSTTSTCWELKCFDFDFGAVPRSENDVPERRSAERLGWNW
ncbi:hypothetical protein EJ08DRAFT_656999 [Tothia fuscella]|uniref:Uncharacterized protein n=1 Tax=Tothia fuscella TaxID=1048955 RepID=A0A9P4U1L7_9PEZI|nr:hypothetical protein EJ08DRAFT_656999 [Tothia fuscella]